MFRIRVELKNPVYHSERDLKVYCVGKTNGNTLEKGKKESVFVVD